MTNERKTFEEEARHVARRSLPPEWREDIIEAALAEPREAGSGPASAWWMPPRWMKVGMAACWVAIGVLHLTRPEPSQVLSAHALEEHADGLPPASMQRELDEAGGVR
mgnify:CR=1 FL=1